VHALCSVIALVFDLLICVTHKVKCACILGWHEFLLEALLHMAFESCGWKREVSEQNTRG
jgi:hypothetical protein